MATKRSGFSLLPSRATVAVGGLLLAAGAVYAQRGGNDWMTIGYDTQRSFWVRADGKISEQTMRKPGFEKVWEMKLQNTARGAQSLTPPALLDFYISYRGFRTLGFVGGSGDTVIGIDTDLARLEWQNGAGVSRQPAGTPACPGGMTSPITRPTNAGYPASIGGRGSGRGTPAKSGVGDPFEGSVVLQELAARRAAMPPPPPPPPPAAAKPGAPVAPPANPFAARIQSVVAITGDGKLHQMYVSNGEEYRTPVQFVPNGAHARGLVVYDGYAYASTVNGCNGTENGIWSIAMETGEVSHWKAPGANVAGTTGFASGPTGDIFAASGKVLARLSSGKLTQKSAFTASAEFSSSPVAFLWNDRNAVAAATSDGKVHVVDGETMKAIASSATVFAGSYSPGALASWQDEFRVRWILVPTEKGITALRLRKRGNSVVLEKAWETAAIGRTITPLIINGVIFAASAGSAGGDAARLYAINAATGKELWSSGNAITSHVTTGGLSAGGGRVYVSTVDGTQYAFGFPMEH